MNKKSILYFLVFSILVITSCNRGALTVRYAYNEKYLLDKGEKEIPINDQIVNEFFEINDVDTFQIPLNRYIISKKHKTYIGLCMFAQLDDLVEAYKKDTSISIFDSRNVKDELSFFFKKKNNYGYKYIYNNKALIVINFISKDSVHINSLYQNENFIPKKLKKE